MAQFTGRTDILKGKSIFSISANIGFAMCRAVGMKENGKIVLYFRIVAQGFRHSVWKLIACLMFHIHHFECKGCFYPQC